MARVNCNDLSTTTHTILRRTVLIWYLPLFIITVVCSSENASCQDEWAEGERLSQNISSSSSVVNGHSADDDGANVSSVSAIPAATLHAALKDYWMERYKEKLLRDFNMLSAPEPGSRRLPKSIRQQLEAIKKREGEEIVEQVGECPPAQPSAANLTHRAIIARSPKPSTSSKNRPFGWTLLHSKAKPVKKVISSTTNPARGSYVQDTMRSYFNLGDLSEVNIKTATLYIHTRQPTDVRRADPVEEVHVHIYKYAGDTQIISEPIASHAFKMDFRPGVWLSVDITSLVCQWANSPAKNNGIMVKAESEGRDYINRTADGFNRTNTIMLALDVDDATNSGGPTNNNSPTTPTPAPIEEPICNPDGGEQKCCRYPLEVNFEEFGWDWVIAPKRYNAFYCAGSCPVNYKQMSAHAHLMQQLDLLYPTTNSHKRSFGPCCTPQDYQDIKVLYIGQDKSIKETRIPAAIVLRCGCA